MNKDYTKYDAIDFAEEPSFIRWVQDKDPHATKFWGNWASEHPEKSTLIKDAKTLVQSIQVIETEPTPQRIQNLWDKIDAATQEEVKEHKNEAVIKPLNRRRWISYAAAACIGLLAVFYFYDPAITISTTKGKHLTYTLPDNSKIELNAASNIRFKEGSYASERTIYMEGEAFFEVEKGATFKVVTPNGTVEVLGTSFNVNTRNEGLEVDCRTGKVKVIAKGSEQILTKGLGTKIDAINLVAPYKSDIARKTGWINGDFYLTNVAFSKVIEELERQYDVQIDCEESLKSKIGNHVFKGDLNKALEEVCYPLNAKFEIKGKTITITPQ